MRSFSAAAILLSAVTGAGVATADQEPVDAATALPATAGKTLAREDPCQEPLGKLDVAVRNGPTPVALIELAACQSQLGATASAWRTYRRAEQQAHTLGDEAREQEAAKRAGALLPRLARVKLVVSAGETRPQIMLDDRVLTENAWGVALPLDRGAHHLVAREPGKRSFSIRFDLSEEGTTKVVLIPRLPPYASETPAVPYHHGATPLLSSDQRGWKRVETAGAALAWVGLLATLPGFVLLGVTSETHPTTSTLIAATASTFGGAIVVGVPGMVMYSVAQKHLVMSSALPRVTLRPFVARNSSGLSLHGDF